MNLRRFAVLVPVCITVIVGANACASSASPAPDKAVSALPACRSNDKPLTLLNPAGLTGPASGSVSNWRVTKSWSIDNGAVQVAPAPAKSKPAVPLLRAACNLLSASSSSGAPMVLSSTSGSILEYGLLTVSAKIPRPSFYLPDTQTTAVPQTFSHRPAWILVTVDFGVASVSAGPSVPGSVSPAKRSPTAPLQTPAPPPWPNDVIALDAARGDASIAYFQGDRRNYTYTVIPYEVVSVPWRNAMVAADDRSARVQIYAPTCDVTWMNGVAIVHRMPYLRIDVGRALGQPCGPDTWNTVTISSADRSGLIPQDLVHTPVGPIDGLYYWGPWAVQ